MSCMIPRAPAQLFAVIWRLLSAIAWALNNRQSNGGPKYRLEFAKGVVVALGLSECRCRSSEKCARQSRGSQCFTHHPRTFHHEAINRYERNIKTTPSMANTKVKPMILQSTVAPFERRFEAIEWLMLSTPQTAHNLRSGVEMSQDRRAAPVVNSPAQVLFASLIGTTIEFFDFYIYATAAVLVFPKMFFPTSDPTTATLASLATFGIAFFARPVGSAVFGHFGDRIGRKATLVAALLTMGLSTVLIGLLPTYAQIGVFAPLLLCLLRFGQGLGLGGEWGGAVLLATENAPPGKQSLYGMFPQLGAPIGFICSSGTFLWLTTRLNDAELLAWGWRVPFLASALLVFVGLYVRLRLTETPAFQRAIEEN